MRFLKRGLLLLRVNRMPATNHMQKILVLGAGTMGAGIAQVAASFGHQVLLYDSSRDALERGKAAISKALKRDIEKGKISEQVGDSTLLRIEVSSELGSASGIKDVALVIEAIVENVETKRDVFRKVEAEVSESTILSTNTSSLSITSIASSCKRPQRVVGLHFFNPAPVMPLVEVVPAYHSLRSVVDETRALMTRWGKVVVLAKDSPGFIVNRIARPFYGESLRILDEGIADVPTIDWAMREVGGFRMGPFELMDFIGNDVNLKVTESIFEAFFYDPRYKPSFTQKRLVEARLYGRKSGKGHYDYSEGAKNPEPNRDQKLGKKIVQRILAMLINEAADALYLGVATREDIDLAMTKGVNYPKGLLAWGDELGASKVLEELDRLQEEYREDRYRASPLLRRLAKEKKCFYE